LHELHLEISDHFKLPECVNRPNKARGCVRLGILSGYVAVFYHYDSAMALQIFISRHLLASVGFSDYCNVSQGLGFKRLNGFISYLSAITLDAKMKHFRRGKLSTEGVVQPSTGQNAVIKISSVRGDNAGFCTTTEIIVSKYAAFGPARFFNAFDNLHIK